MSPFLHFRTWLRSGPAGERVLLASVGVVPYPAGPRHATSPSLPTGGDVWRPGVWKTSCQCWQVTNVHHRST